MCSPREGYWSRVLRRYYTESRRSRSTTLLTKWDEHLADFPSDCQYILDYVCFFQGDMEFCDRLFGYLKRQGPLFDSIQILLYETLLLKPFPTEPNLRKHLIQKVRSHFLGEDGFEAPIGYVKGLQALVIYKFGDSSDADFLASMFQRTVLDSPAFASYGLPVLAATHHHRQLALDAIEQIEDSRILRIRALLERLENGDDKAISVLLGLLQPKETKFPTTWVMNSRALPLLKIALGCNSASSLKRIQDAKKRFSEKLKNIKDATLVDWITLEHLGQSGIPSSVP